MPDLWNQYLPLVQSVNDYGGNFASIHIRRPVLDATDAGALVDPSLVALRDKLREKMHAWSGLQDYKAFSQLFEAYYEALFYLLSCHCGVALRFVPEHGKKGGSPDFATATAPLINFEVKTIDLADPEAAYKKIMTEGLDAKLEAEAEARQRGVGTSVREIAPHGVAKDRRDVVEQIMRKIDSNVKAGQYVQAPTFLVVSAARTSLHQRAENLRKWLTWPGAPQPASGQLFTIAAHRLGDPFFFFPEHGVEIRNLGPIHRAGILRDHDYIPGLIFLASEMGKYNAPQPVEGIYAFNGIWNSHWAASNHFGTATTDAARAVFTKLCQAWNDTEGSRDASLPE